MSLNIPEAPAGKFIHSQELDQPQFPRTDTVYESHEAMMAGLLVGKSEDEARAIRRKHYLAQQFALGPLGDLKAIRPGYRIPIAYPWHNDEEREHYLDGRRVDDQNPYNDETIDPLQRFENNEEFASLVGYYRSRLTSEERQAIQAEEDIKKNLQESRPPEGEIVLHQYSWGDPTAPTVKETLVRASDEDVEGEEESIKEIRRQLREAIKKSEEGQQEVA